MIFKIILPKVEFPIKGDSDVISSGAKFLARIGVGVRGVLGIMLIALLLLGCDSAPGGVDLIPGTPRLVSPANGSTDEENALFLEWRGSEEATNFHIQVSVRSDFADVQHERLAHPGHIFIVNELEIGTTYYWRIRAYNDAGFSDWSAPWWFRPSTPASPPEIPQLVFPPNQETELPPDVEFKWRSVQGARYYNIQASQSTDFYNQEANMEILADTTQRVTQLIHGYTYYWRVRARNAAGYSSWSPIWNIVIADSN